MTKGAAYDALKEVMIAYIPRLFGGLEEIPLECAMAIVKMPSTQPQWISVTERLPERGKDVLVTRDYDGRADHIKSCRYVEVASCYGEDDDVSWNSYSDEYKMTPKNHRVVAWMPLPEPYKGEKE